MKKIIFIASILIVSIVGCTKQNNPAPKSFPSILYYRIQEEDFGNASTYSKVVVVGDTKQTTTIVTDDGGDNGRTCSTADHQSNWYLEHCVITPVTFVSVSAQVNQRIVTLNWQTGVESNIKTFIIQRSQDGISYENIGFVDPKGISGGGSSYEFLDKSYN